MKAPVLPTPALFKRTHTHELKLNIYIALLKEFALKKYK